MKDVQCYELFGGIALKNHAFSFSSENECCTIWFESIMVDKGLIYREKSTGPRNEPWGTPEYTEVKAEQ